MLAALKEKFSEWKTGTSHCSWLWLVATVILEVLGVEESFWLVLNCMYWVPLKKLPICLSTMPY